METMKIVNVPISKVVLGRNSRTKIKKDELASLMKSIKEVGLLQPIGVTKDGANYEVCYGNRRFMALQKLGVGFVPVIIQDPDESRSETDLKNLTENIQRRSLTLTEVGSYINILKNDGLGYAEIAVRLGVTKSYVLAAADAYGKAPEEFRPDVEVKIQNDRTRTPGKINITQAKAITFAKERFGLSADQQRVLFTAAKSDDRFNIKNVRHYAAAIKQGKKDPVGQVPMVHHIQCTFWVSSIEKEALERKYVENGSFKSIQDLCKAILRGEKKATIQMLKNI